jgi:NTP pyrophosphatase (non-canonical NTP hydrolase)
MKQLFDEITTWQDKTFGETTPLSVAKHLRKEVDEVIEALEKGSNRHVIQEELPDLNHLIFNLAMRLGLDYYQLEFNTRTKFEKNLQRKWLKPDADGCVHHEKEVKVEWSYFFGYSGGGTFDRYYEGVINGIRVEKHSSNKGKRFSIGNIDNSQKVYNNEQELIKAVIGE